MNALIFNNVTLTPISNNDGQIWLTSKDLANALGYKQSRAVTKIFNQNSDEFTDRMTVIHEVPNLDTTSKTKGLTTKIRIFSLRGCHLIAMFSRTKVAKDFRKWVLDVLDKEVGEPVAVSQKTSSKDRRHLVGAVNMLVKRKVLDYSTAYTLVNQYMGTQHIDEIPFDELPKAVEYVHNLILKSAITEPTIDNKEIFEVCHSAVDFGLELLHLRASIDKCLNLSNEYDLLHIADKVNEAIAFSKNHSIVSEHGQPLYDNGRIACYHGNVVSQASRNNLLNVFNELLSH